MPRLDRATRDPLGCVAELARRCFIGGTWIETDSSDVVDVVDPSTEQRLLQIAAGSAVDIDRAVSAAVDAFPAYSQTTCEQRLELLQRISALYEQHADVLAMLVSKEMGAPRQFARDEQVASGLAHLRVAIGTLSDYRFEYPLDAAIVRREPIGVCGLITPWNWPLNQILCKVAPALAAGCTMVLKPSEVAPLSALLFAAIVEQAGVPPGVFNLVNGTGHEAGAALSRHPGVDMMSFTGSTRAGVLVSQAAAPTVKRVALELGGKSPNIILPDAELAQAVRYGVALCFANSGQSCSAPSRMLVPRQQLPAVERFAHEAALEHRVGLPEERSTTLGPVANRKQYETVQSFIRAGCDEGAQLLVGGAQRPEGLERGYFVRPTIFSGVLPSMGIAREEIFGPVLSIMVYDDVEQAIAIANDTPYGLNSYVQSSSPQHALAVARRIRAGQVQINYPPWNAAIPFGGYKQSGNGREHGVFGLEEFLETKAILAAPSRPSAAAGGAHT